MPSEVLVLTRVAEVVCHEGAKEQAKGIDAE